MGITKRHNTEELTEYINWREFPRRYPDLVTFNQMRHLVQSRHYNGLGSACLKLHSRMILVHVPSFISWLKRQG